MFEAILNKKLSADRGFIKPKRKPPEEVERLKRENFERAAPGLENPDEVKQMLGLADGGRIGYGNGGLGQKYLYPDKDSGYRVMATKGNEKIYKPFPKNQLKEAKAFAKGIEEKFDKIEAKNPRPVTGIKLTVYNKFAQDIHGKNYNDLTTAEKNIVQTRYRQSGGKFRKTFQTNELTDLNKERIKKAFPDVEFEFKKGQKYGVVKELKNGKLNPEFTAVRNFVNNNYKLSTRKSLPVSTQRDIAARFELPKGVKEWNFDVNKGGYLYGVPDTSGANMNLGKRIINFVNEPKPFKLAADFSNPEGWLLSQMNRAYESKQNPNFIPKRDLVNGKKKIVGFTDNQHGGGKTYYALKKYAKKFNGTMMTEHPDFKNTKKYIDIANKVKLSPNKVIKDLLVQGGVIDDKITLNTLLQYMINEKGVEPTKRGLVLHHKGGASGNPTRDFQILNMSVNNKIKSVELAMRNDKKNITPKNIKFLKDMGASITIDGKTYGGGPNTAIGGFKQAEKLVQSTLEGYDKKQFKDLTKHIKNVKNFASSKGFTLNNFAGALDLSQANINIPPSVRQSLGKIVTAGKVLGKGAVVLDPMFAAMDFSKAMGEGVSGTEAAKYTGKKFLQDIYNLPKTLEDVAYLATDKGTLQNFGEKENRLFSYKPKTFADDSLAQYIEATSPELMKARKANIAYAQTMPTFIDDMELPKSKEELDAEKELFFQERGTSVSDLYEEEKEPEPFALSFMGGGIVGIRKPNAIPPKKGPQPQGLDYLRYYGT